MVYKVTPGQYAKLLERRDAWPEKLGLIRYMKPDGTAVCAVGHLAAGISPELRHPNRDYILIDVSDAYGIPEDLLGSWQACNDLLYFFSTRSRRARKMKEIYETFLDQVVVMTPPLAESNEERMAAGAELAGRY